MTDALRAIHLLSRVLACEACCPVERALVADFLATGPRVERCERCGFARFADSACPCSDHDVRVHPSYGPFRAVRPPPEDPELTYFP